MGSADVFSLSENATSVPAANVLTVYLTGASHSGWREGFIERASEHGLSATWLHPQLDHDRSDRVGAQIMGGESDIHHFDRKSALLNVFRNRRLIRRSDVIVAKLDKEIRGWNVAMELGWAAANGIPYITMYSDLVSHMAKELDAQAMAVCENMNQNKRDPMQQAIECLAYMSEGVAGGL